MKNTENKIYNNIEESDYFLTYKDYKFYFSSKFYMNKYIKLLNEIFDKNKIIMLKRYLIVNNEKFENMVDSILFIYIYQITEKRGFRVYYNNERIEVK